MDEATRISLKLGSPAPIADAKMETIGCGKPGDWVKELFAPIYDFDAIVEAGKNGYQLGDSKIKRAPILEQQTIKEVFERVHQRVVESEKLKEEEKEEKKQEELDKLIDPRNSCLWDTEELETLRKVYKAAKGEISKLEVECRERKSRNSQLEKVVIWQRKEMETLRSQLSETKKANQRLAIHRDDLRKSHAVMEVKMAALTEMWHDIESEKNKAMEAAKQANLKLDEERLLRQKLESDLIAMKQNSIRDAALIESNIQTKCEMEMNDLQDVIKDLTVELQEERRLHEASKRGLEHLRNHFSSLPLNHILPPNAVEKDQVEKIDHVGL